MNSQFTQRVSDIILYSKEEANRLRNNYIGPEHLLLGIIRDGEGKAIDILKSLYVDLKEIKRELEDLLRTDYKEFHIAGHDLAVSQITCMDSDRLLQRKDEFLALMSSIRKSGGFDMVILMITDVLLEGTQLLFVGERDSIRQAFNVPESEDAENAVFLPKIMSRKKQVIPMLSALWG